VTPQTQQPGTNPHGGTRRDQLLALLRERGGPVHVSEIARSLGISRPHASGVAIKASRAGLAWRLRAGTGYYHQALDVGGPPPELIDATPERPRTRKARSTRQDQLVALLLQRGGPVHLDEVAEELGFKRVNADVLASRAVKAGIVQRVGRLSSRIALPNWQQHPPPDGIQRRAYNALVKLADWSTARQVAGVLGCRSREAGNALTLLVKAGLVDRRRGGGTTVEPSRYRAW